jgi:hypothetical protein
VKAKESDPKTDQKRETTMKSQEKDAPAVTEMELYAEELESVIAPGVSPNHNETFVVGSVELEAEELEPVIAPGINLNNHNETFVSATILPD